jgi:hypothetical protein
LAASETQSFTGVLYGVRSFPVLSMDSQLNQWKRDVERIWSSATPDYREAARLAAEIADTSATAVLRHAATQALPILRNAAPRGADPSTQDAALRRLRVIRAVLHQLTAPQFGQRETGLKVLTPEQRYRQLLGLPFGRRLAAAEIHQAYKHAAKTAHPDGGGDARQFLDLCAARDALMKAR